MIVVAINTLSLKVEVLASGLKVKQAGGERWILWSEVTQIEAIPIVGDAVSLNIRYGAKKISLATAFLKNPAELNEVIPSPNKSHIIIAMAPPVVTLKLQDDKEALKAAYLSCHDAVEKRRIQAVWQLAEGKTREQVRELTAFSNSVLINIMHRYNEAGLAGLKDKRRQNKGVAPLLNEAERERLYKVLLEPPEAGGLWSGPKVAAWMSETLNRLIRE